MSFALAILFDRIPAPPVDLNTRLHSCPLVFIRGSTSSSSIYAWISDTQNGLTLGIGIGNSPANSI